MGAQISLHGEIDTFLRVIFRVFINMKMKNDCILVQIVNITERKFVTEGLRKSFIK